MALPAIQLSARRTCRWLTLLYLASVASVVSCKQGAPSDHAVARAITRRAIPYKVVKSWDIPAGGEGHPREQAGNPSMDLAHRSNISMV